MSVEKRDETLGVDQGIRDDIFSTLGCVPTIY